MILASSSPKPSPRMTNARPRNRALVNHRPWQGRPVDNRRPPLGAVVPRLALRTAEAAAACGVSEDFWAAEIAPSIPCVRRGRLKLYPVASVATWLTDNAELLLDDRRAA